MDKKHEAMVWTLAAIAGLGVLWFVIRREQNTSASDPNALYNDYNLSPGGATGTASGLPTIPAAAGNGGDCGCTSASGGNFFNSLSGMLNTFMQGAGKAFQTYEQGIADTYPTTVAQYFNNPAGVAMEHASSAILTNPASAANAGSSNTSYLAAGL